MAGQRCPICPAAVRLDRRYPRYVCGGCAAAATSPDGRRVAFGNDGVSGGCTGRYADTGAVYPSAECLVRGVRCVAAEAHMGGVVIQPAG